MNRLGASAARIGWRRWLAGRQAAIIAGLAALASAGCGPATDGSQSIAGVAARPGSFVTVNEAIPDALFEIRYFTASNFLGDKVDGYQKPLCLLSEPASSALAKVQEDLREQGYSLKIFDCYRPQRAVDHFVRWAKDAGDQKMKMQYYPNEDKAQLIPKGYIAERSGHSRGSTLDLSLARLSDGSELDMGTPFDYFDALSNTADSRIAERQRANRLLLKAAMERRGFVNYDKEWWHYTLADEPFPDTYFDFPIE